MQNPVPMHLTPWYLRLFGFRKWRVVSKVHDSHGDHAGFVWRYYHDIHDYVERNS